YAHGGGASAAWSTATTTRRINARITASRNLRIQGPPGELPLYTPSPVTVQWNSFVAELARQTFVRLPLPPMIGREPVRPIRREGAPLDPSERPHQLAMCGKLSNQQSLDDRRRRIIEGRHLQRL